MSRPVPLLIVGAGPFGLAMARYARARGIDHRVVGRPMAFWREHMPEGMILRSGTSWHLDPDGELTFEAWIADRGLAPDQLDPLALDRYLDYAEWYRNRAGIDVDDRLVESLSRGQGKGGELFRVRLSDGATIEARNVYLAVGFAYFENVPEELAERIPRARRVHTCDLADVGKLRGRRVLVIGGRQSAFETAALACEAGARAVWLSHRHPSPAIAPSDWSWVDELVTRMVDDPGWYRRLAQSEREEIDRRFWREGRLKVEPWLGPRLDPEVVRTLPETRMATCEEANGALRIVLQAVPDAGSGAADPYVIEVDDVVLATGYRVDLGRVPFLDPGLVQQLHLRDGFPPLDTGFQTRVPGLFVTSMPATRDFGAFLAFTVSVRSATRVAGRAIRARLAGGSA